MKHTKKSVILDMDPGVDDALGILLAVKSKALDIKGISVCGGNISVNQCAINTLKILNQCDAVSIPVARGAFQPLFRITAPDSHVHGDDGMGGLSGKYDVEDKSSISNMFAPDFILDILEKSNEKITIIATAPLTNIALAISKNRTLFKSKVKEIFWMGGAYNTCGNVTPLAEFNAYFDPDAVKVVFDSDVKITAIGLDITMKCPFSKSVLDEIKTSNPSKIADFVSDFTKDYFDYYEFYTGEKVCYLHDVIAVAFCIWGDLMLESENFKGNIILDGIATGQTFLDLRPFARNKFKKSNNMVNNFSQSGIILMKEEKKENLKVVWDMKFEDFMQRFVEVVFS